MLNITPLTADELALAYPIAYASHRHPCSLNTFLSKQGPLYLNLKLVALGSLVGFAITQVVHDAASLFNLAIHPKARRQGYAYQLLLALIQQLSSQTVAQLWLEVHVSNYPARTLYQKLNFTEVSIRSGYYSTDQGYEDAIVLVKDLTK